jgi:hypothetical protein
MTEPYRVSGNAGRLAFEWDISFIGGAPRVISRANDDPDPRAYPGWSSAIIMMDGRVASIEHLKTATSGSVMETQSGNVYVLYGPRRDWGHVIPSSIWDYPPPPPPPSVFARVLAEFKRWVRW